MAATTARREEGERGPGPPLSGLRAGTYHSASWGEGGVPHPGARLALSLLGGRRRPRGRAVPSRAEVRAGRGARPGGPGRPGTRHLGSRQLRSHPASPPPQTRTSLGTVVPPPLLSEPPCAHWSPSPPRPGGPSHTAHRGGRGLPPPTAPRGPQPTIGSGRDQEAEIEEIWILMKILPLWYK